MCGEMCQVIKGDGVVAEAGDLLGEVVHVLVNALPLGLGFRAVRLQIIEGYLGPVDPAFVVAPEEGADGVDQKELHAPMGKRRGKLARRGL